MERLGGGNVDVTEGEKISHVDMRVFMVGLMVFLIMHVRRGAEG